MKQHNIDKVRRRARSVVFACPSCYHTWREEYATDLRFSTPLSSCWTLFGKGKIEFRMRP
jgi:Fe-S oxidoreductase